LEDVIRVKDRFYVLATSPFADDRTRVLKYGDFCRSQSLWGYRVSSLGEQGLYHGTEITRFVVFMVNTSVSKSRAASFRLSWSKERRSIL
jgi:hypothetical protein